MPAVRQRKAFSLGNVVLLTCALFLVCFIGFGLVLRGPFAQTPSPFGDNLNKAGSVTEGSAGAGDSKQDEGAAETGNGAQEDDGQEAGKEEEYDISELLTPEQHEASLNNTAMVHHDIFSNMTSDGKYFRVDFVDEGSYNPNIIPHSYKPDTWIMVAQRDKLLDDNIIWNSELVCEATFIPEENTMRCKKSPMILPIASTMSQYCHGLMDYFNDQIGPHDARVFYGPAKPYIIYTSQSHFNCLGQWVQDLRRITNWDAKPTTNVSRDDFYWPTNLQRPPPYGEIEKNWFMFWDFDGIMYLHYDIAPSSRTFAKLERDGSVGKDLAPLSAKHDETCMQRLMPKLRNNTLEWLHQSTNSLSVTMCSQLDPNCVASENNTFIMTVFQTKTFYYHGVYEPYVMLFRQRAPFEVYAVTTVPFWINGRGRAHEDWTAGTTKPKDQNQLLFTTSMGWKLKPGDRGGRPGSLTGEELVELNMMEVNGYHGFVDDTIFLGFGVEDQASGGIDVVVRDLLANLTLCDGGNSGFDVG